MSFRDFLPAFPSSNAKRTTSGSRRSNARQAALNFQQLEQRNLLAGIYLNPTTSELFISGGSGNDVGSLVQVNATTVRANISGLSSQDFPAADVAKVVFLGFGGNDTFNNNTAIEGLLLGNDGDDTLNGGSGFDQINGGAGNDRIEGRGGNDRLIANFGNDFVYGGEGDDSIFGSAGINELNGEAGDDLIFGGDERDTINGGDGIDQIFGLGGDDILSAGNGGVVGSSGTGQADLVLGLDGDDTITGGTGLNVFYGGEGNDVMTGGNGENRIHGQNGNDRLTGGTGNDYLAGNVGDDIITALGGADYILPGFGDDTVNAGSGTDRIVFNSTFSNYQITGSGSSLTVFDTRGIDGRDGITNAEIFRFTDGDRPAESGASLTVRVQPIIVSNSNGSNTAEFFGSSAEEAIIKALIDDIYYAAGVDIQWLTATTWNNTFANVGNQATRPTSDLGTVVQTGDDAGRGNSNPLIIDMYFVEKAAGFNDTGENVGNGLAYVDANGITMHIGDNLPTFEAGRQVVARVAAHEIGHNLGLEHFGTNNLMSESGSGTALTTAQINTIRDSQFAI